MECWGWLRSTSGGYIVPQSEHYETFATIESGTYHVCALREDGSPVCWGDNGSGEATPPEGEKFAAISAGYEHTCALRQHGSPVCWGDPIARYAFGQASPPEGERLITISSGAYHTCALRQGGAPVCWGAQLGDEGKVIGRTGFGQSNPPAGEQFVSISSGGLHSCALRADGSPVCWGKGFPTPKSAGAPPPPVKKDGPGPALKLPRLPTLPPGITPPPAPVRLRGRIAVHASSFVAPLAMTVSRGFMNIHEDVEIDVDAAGGESPQVALARFVAGNSDIANVPRRINDGEAATAAGNGVQYLELPVATRLIAVMAHQENDFAQCITVDQLRAVWEPGSVVDSWNDLDPSWPDWPIFRYGQRDDVVSTAFARLLFGESRDLHPDGYTLSDPGSALISDLRGHRGALGYADYAYYSTSGEGVRLLAIDAGERCVGPFPDAFELSPDELVIGPLYVYVNKSSLARPEVRAFVEYYMEEAPWSAPKTRCAPLAPEQYRKNLALLMGCTTAEMRSRDGNILEDLDLPDCWEPAPSSATSDRAALVALYNATDGPNWKNNANWASDRPLGRWYGVTTDGNGRVTRLDLHDNRLTGRIPAQIANLSNLGHLSLSFNQLTGPMPPQLTNLASLELLWLSDNKLTGPIPPQLGNLANLWILSLGFNRLDGTIPPQLGNLTNLEDLRLNDNQLVERQAA